MVSQTKTKTPIALQYLGKLVRSVRSDASPAVLAAELRRVADELDSRSLEDDGPWTHERVSERYRREIPSGVLASLNHFVLTARRPGSFATAVLENDLRYAFGYADDECRTAMPVIVEYCHNRLPSVCWGSKSRVRQWEGCDESELETDSLVWPEGSR